MRREPGLHLLLVPALCIAAQWAGAQETGIPLAPPQASTIAPTVDQLFDFVLTLSAIIAGSVCLLIVGFAYKYRRGATANRSHPPTQNIWLEATWIGIPVILALGTFIWAARVFFDEYAPPPGALNITVVGKQWMWKLQHPEGQQEINELHIPVGRPIKLNLISQDVIHDFFVPAFRIKQDVLPGRYTTAWFQATKAGRYHLFCAQYCGTQHANMGGWIYVMEPADYQNWLERTHVEPSLATEGSKLFVQFSCTGCHAHSATVRAPSLNGLYGRPVPLSDGSVVVADDRYIHDSIVLPGSQVVAGYQNIMPSFQGAMSEAQLLALTAYVRSLGQNSEQQNAMQPQNNLTTREVREMQRRAQEEHGQMRRKLPPAAEYPQRINALKPQISTPTTPNVPESSGDNLKAEAPAARNPSGAEPSGRIPNP